MLVSLLEIFFSITSRYFVSIDFDPFCHILLWKIMKKLTLCHCERDRRGAVCACTQSDRRLSCSLLDMALFIYSGLNLSFPINSL